MKRKFLALLGLLVAATVAFTGVSPAQAATAHWSSWKVCNGPSPLADWSIRTYFSANSSGYAPQELQIKSSGTGADPYYQFKVTHYNGNTILKSINFLPGRTTSPNDTQYGINGPGYWPRSPTSKAVVALKNSAGSIFCTVTNT